MYRTYLLILTVAFALSTSAFAGQGNGHGNGNGNGHGNPHKAQRDNDHDRDDHDRDDHGRWVARNGWEYRTYERGHTPPGWSKGKKTGWGNCNLPPGQAKKYGCNQYRYQNRDYYWYHDDVGRIIVRRPVIHVHAGVDVGF
jgi:hypothetical protein